MEQRRPERSATYCAALALLLLAALATFLSANDYPIFSTEVALLTLAFSIAGCLLAIIALFLGRTIAALVLGLAVAFSIDLLFGLNAYRPLLVIVPVVCMVLAFLLRDHVATIVACASAVLLVSTLLIPVTDSRAIPQEGRAAMLTRTVSTNPHLPVLVHLILDEHIGVSGIPPEIDGGARTAERLVAFYVNHGFRIYEDAYSEYSDTELSLPQLFNFSSDDRSNPYLFDGKGEPYVLKQSAYFGWLVSQGYRLKVYQSDYMDLCRVPQIAYASCATYSGHKIGALYHTKLASRERARFILNSFLAMSYYVRKLRAIYERFTPDFVQFSLGAWRVGATRVGPVSVLPALEDLVSDLRTAQRGTAFVAHLLIPHHPYMLDPNCALRPNIDHWFGNAPAVPAAERAKRYRYYFLQISCQQRLLERLFNALKDAGVWDDAIVIVHGDHGSRIVQNLPVPENAAKLTVADFRDAFSTLFALRAPGVPAGSVHGIRPLQSLLGEAVGVPATTAHPRVYLRPKEGRLAVYELTNLALFDDGDHASQASMRQRIGARPHAVAAEKAW